jgi:hypothetical protein
MEQHDGVQIRRISDPVHPGKYQVELEAEFPGTYDPIKTTLESAGYALVDFDQWGLTFSSKKDLDLRVDVDELDDYGDTSRLILCKGRLSESDIDRAKSCLLRTYREVAEKAQILATEAA